MKKVKSKNTVLRLWALLLGIMVLMISHGFQNTFIAIRAEFEQFPTLIIAVILSSHYVGNFVSSITVGPIIQKVGHVRALAAFAAVASSATLLLALYINPYFWILARAGSGWAITGMLFVCESWVQGFATNKNRGFIFSIYMTHIFFGLASGQFLLTFVDFSSFSAFAVVSILFSLGVVPLLLSAKTKPRPLEKPKKKLGIIKLFAFSPLGLFGIFIIGGLHAIMYNMLPIYAARSGITTDFVAYGISILVIFGAIAQVPFGKLSDMFDRRIVMLFIAVMAAAALTPLMFITPDNFIFLLSCGAIGIFIFPLYSICISHVNDRVESGYRLAIIGVMILLNGIGSIVSLMVVGFLLSFYGVKSFFAAAVAMCLSLTLLLIVRLLMRNPEKSRSRNWFGIPFFIRPTTHDNIVPAELKEEEEDDGKH